MSGGQHLGAGHYRDSHFLDSPVRLHNIDGGALVIPQKPIGMIRVFFTNTKI